MANQILDRRTVAIPGPAGEDGTDGVKGDKGDTGPRGPQGLPGVNAVPADEAVAAYVADDLAQTHAAVSEQIHRPETDIELISSEDRLANTKRLRITSSQKQEAENNFEGGEVLWLDLADPRAKAMLTWRLRYDPTTRVPYAPGAAPVDAPFRRVVWCGAHYYAQDQPDDMNPTVIHGHWSVETPRPDGQLYTRFQVFFNDRADPSKVGAEVALISTNRADFMIGRETVGGGEQAGRFIISGSHAIERGMELGRGDDSLAGRRWFVGVTGQTESSGNAGANFIVRRHADDGTELGKSIFIKRDTGTITLGSEAWEPGSSPTQVMVSSDGGDQNGILINPRAKFTGGAAVRARFTDLAVLAFAAQIQSQLPRFTINAAGRVSWGKGESAVDVYLEREDTGRIGTNGSFSVGGGLRVAGATNEGKGVGLIAINNVVTVPSESNASGGLIYVEGGKLKYKGSSGTVTTIAEA